MATRQGGVTDDDDDDDDDLVRTAGAWLSTVASWGEVT